MEFFLEMLLTAVVAVLFSFLVAKLVSASMAGGVNDRAEETEIGVGDGFLAAEELCSGLKMDAPVVQSERKLLVVVDENVEDDGAVDEVEEGAKGEDFVVTSDESLAAVSPENVVAEEMIVPGEDERRDSAEEKVREELEEFIVRTVEEAESTASVFSENVVAQETIVLGEDERRDSAEEQVSEEGEEFIVRSMKEAEASASVSPENVIAEEAESIASVSLKNMIAEEIMVRGQEEGRSAEVVVAESEEVSVEDSSTVEESERKMELNTEEKEELSIEEDDDWEGIERSELEKAFATTSNLLEESGKAEEFGDEVKMELYGLYKIATEGSCREAQPMAIMVSARAKWNAWQKLGNMSQEEAMEQYLALVSKEIPGLINTVGKIPVLPPNSGSLEDPTTLGTTVVAFSKNVSAER